MPEGATENKVEVEVGRREYTTPGPLQFIGEKVRFRGERLGHHITDTSMDSSGLKRTQITLVLYRCPGGYRVFREERTSRRHRERGRWTMEESTTTLLPMVNEEGAGQNEQAPVYGLYSEEEARREFPDLFSAVGMPNVRELD